MKVPPRLIPLLEDGIIDEVLGQVKSGKEADVFIVRVGNEARCAKVYKDANNRSFRQAATYQEGRKVQNSRSARAIAKRTRFGQKEAEASWIGAEVAALNALSAAGVRVPRPYGFFDGVLLMELIVGEDGQPAPRLNDLQLEPETALLYHEELISQIVRMLCVGIIHGDLSEFNVLVDAEGPVIIDLPQAVNAAGNNSAPMLFARDVDNMARWFGRFEPGILGLKYAKEIWSLYEKNRLTPEVTLTGRYEEPKRAADVGGVLDAIGDARKEHEHRAAKKAGQRFPRPGDRGPERPPGRHGTPEGSSHPRPDERPRTGPGQGAHPRDGQGPHTRPDPRHGPRPGQGSGKPMPARNDPRPGHAPGKQSPPRNDAQPGRHGPPRHDAQPGRHGPPRNEPPRPPRGPSQPPGPRPGPGPGNAPPPASPPPPPQRPWGRR